MAKKSITISGAAMGIYSYSRWRVNSDLMAPLYLDYWYLSYCLGYFGCHKQVTILLFV